MVDSARITLLAAPGPIIGALAELTSTIVNPHDLPTEQDRSAQVLADTGCDVVVMSDDLPCSTALDLGEHLARSFPEIEVVLLASTEPNTLVGAMAAGIRLVLDPASPVEQLRSEVGRIGAAARLRRDRLGRTSPTGPNIVNETEGRIITVIAAKGGVGKTTIAVNLAVQLARLHPHQVVLADLDLMAGDADLLLDLAPTATLASVAIQGSEVDSASVKLALTTHSSGLLVLPAPETLIEGDAIDPELVVKTLELLRKSFGFVVIDTAPGAGDALVAAVELADDIVAVASADLGGLRSLRRNLDGFDALGLTTARRHLVLNKADHRTGLTVQSIEAAIELAIAQAIPEDRDIPVAANQGLAYVVTNPKAEAVRALKALAARLDPASQVGASPSSGFGQARSVRSYESR